MTKIRARGEDVRRFILDNIEKHPADISRITSKHFNITRQAVSKHLQKLTAEQALAESGHTRNRVYKLVPLSEWKQSYEIISGIAEDLVWRKDVCAALGNMPDNVLDIWHYGFTEMFNNAIDHSGGSKIVIHIRKTAANTEMLLHDDGIGIFKKIQTALDLLDERHALLELAPAWFADLLTAGACDQLGSDFALPQRPLVDVQHKLDRGHCRILHRRSE